MEDPYEIQQSRVYNIIIYRYIRITRYMFYIIIYRYTCNKIYVLSCVFYAHDSQIRLPNRN